MSHDATILICGFGSLGQYCLEGLRQFARHESALRFRIIELAAPTEWVIDDRESCADLLLLGDCRSPEILKEAGIETCQAALFVTSDERVNIQGALAARSLNKEMRIVVRSSKSKLNELLQSELGDFVALNATELPAPAFVNAGVNSELLSSFGVHEHEFRIRRHKIGKSKEITANTRVSDHEHVGRRVVSWRPQNQDAVSPPDIPTNAFFQWHADTQLVEGDVLVTLDDVSGSAIMPESSGAKNKSFWQKQWKRFGSHGKRLRLWFDEQRQQPLVAIGCALLLLLMVLTTVLFKIADDDATWLRSVAASVILLLGGYADVAGPPAEPAILPTWFRVYGLFVTLMCFLFLVGVVGVITNSVVHSKLEFLRKKTPMPTEGHLVIIGYRRLGRKVTELLQRMNIPFVVLSLSPDDLIETNDPTIPIVRATGEEAFELVNLSTARGILILTEDELLNIEIALRVKAFAQQQDVNLSIAVRVFDSSFSISARQLIPGARILAAYQLAGQAFAAAAFGEQILGMFRVGDQGIFIAEYEVRTDDHLHDRLIGHIAYGFGVVPVCLWRNPKRKHEQMTVVFPGEDVRVQDGDHLTVLASINGLRRIEQGAYSEPRRWELSANKPLNPAFVQPAGAELARYSGCPLKDAMSFVESLPGRMTLKLYTNQADRLKRHLSRQLDLTLKPLDETPRMTPEMSAVFRVEDAE